VDGKILKYLFLALASLVVLYPLSVWYGRAGADLAFDETLSISLFPAIGLAAFSVMWLHVVGGALRVWLSKYFDFQKFVNVSSIAVFFLIILHPLLLFIGIGFRNIGLIFEINEPIYIWLAIIAWFILVGYDIAKRFKKRDFFVRHWEAVKLISTIGFFLTLFHSLGVGSDLQAGPLRYVWFFYGTTAAIAATYTYGIKRLLK